MSIKDFNGKKFIYCHCSAFYNSKKKLYSDRNWLNKRYHHEMDGIHLAIGNYILTC